MIRNPYLIQLFLFVKFRDPEILNALDLHALYYYHEADVFPRAVVVNFNIGYEQPVSDL